MESLTRRAPLQPKHNAPRFVGRRKEITRIEKALFRGETIIVSGKYGIGRTALVRHIAAGNTQYWRFVFVDGSRSASDICRSVFVELFSGAGSGCTKSGLQVASRSHCPL